MRISCMPLHDQTDYGHRTWVVLEPEGKLELTLHNVEPVTEENIYVGIRVQRGPSWMYTEELDGGMGQLGTVLGCRKSDNSSFGMCPESLPLLHAVVKWDKAGKVAHPIGYQNQYMLGLANYADEDEAAAHNDWAMRQLQVIILQIHASVSISHTKCSQWHDLFYLP